jgi:hypothetical protein
MSETTSLYEAFASVPDPRQPSGKRHPLQAVLTLICVAMLSGCRSLYAIAQFGRDRGKAFAPALGFTRDQTICCTMIHYLLRDMDRMAFEKAIAKWIASRARDGWEAVSFDGKTLCGTTGVQLPGVHLLAAYAHEAQLVLEQIPVNASTNEHKAALELLELIPVKDKIVVGDAMFCQRDLSRKIRQKRGHWLWPVKENQSELLDAVRDGFDDSDISPSTETACQA